MTESAQVRASFEVLEPPLHHWLMRVSVKTPRPYQRAARLTASVGGETLQGVTLRPDGITGFLTRIPSLGAALVLDDGGVRIPTGIQFRPPSAPPSSPTAKAKGLSDERRSRSWALGDGCSVKGDKVTCANCEATESRISGAPKKLVTVAKPYVVPGASHDQLDETAAQAFVKMRDAAVADGVIASDGPYLLLVSGYRSYASQKSLWRDRLRAVVESFGATNWSSAIAPAVDRTNDALEAVPPPHDKNKWLTRFQKELGGARFEGVSSEKMKAAAKAEGIDVTAASDPVEVAVHIARQTVAPPGVSPHHTGRALDLSMGHHPHAKSDVHSSPKNVAWQREQAWFRWLVCHAASFGFTPYNREPWHWEFHTEALAKGAGVDDVADAGGDGDSDRDLFRVEEQDHRSMAQSLASAAATRQGYARAQWFDIAWMLAYANMKDRASIAPRAATHDDAFACLASACYFADIPWRVAWVILEHEGGLSVATHSDGVMQTISSARRTVVSSIPKLLLLSALGKFIDDKTSDADLQKEALREFPNKISVQIAFGVTELMLGLKHFGGYIALACAAYNTGTGNVETMLGSTAPANLADATWLTTCRETAARIHAGNVTVASTWWQCDGNMPGWFAAARVNDSTTGRFLAGFKYLRSFTFSIHKTPPADACSMTQNHKAKKPGAGPMINKVSRNGVLDKFYDPTLMDHHYVDAVTGGMPAITDNKVALRAKGATIYEVDASGNETAI